MCGVARQYIAEPGERLDAAALAGRDEAHQNGRCPTAIVASEKGPVAAVDGDVAIGRLRELVPTIPRVDHLT